MKSKKIVAMFVALLTFMAVATSGLAAVTTVSTTTIYNQITDKVVVDVDVTGATPGSEVTYLVKSNNVPVYIDQKTADGSGNVGFDYKIAQAKIVDLSTNVQFGTNGEVAISGDDEAIQLDNVAITSDGYATVEFFKDAACAELIGNTAIIGDGDTIYAKITVADGREIDETRLAGLGSASGNIYTVTDSNISIYTKTTGVAADVVEPEQDELKGLLSEPVTVEVGGQTVAATKYTKVFKVVGQPSDVGVIYNNELYKALPEGVAYADGSLYAVAIIVDNNTVIDALPTYCE